jgi:hypothetical protein
MVKIRSACVTLIVGEPDATWRVRVLAGELGMIFTSCEDVVSVKVILPIVRAVFTATFCVAVYSPTKEAVLPLPDATTLDTQFPVPPQIPVPAAPVQVPL